MRKALVLLLLACGRGAAVPPPPNDPPPSSTVAAVTCKNLPPLAMHEWGTYTSVHAADGHALEGLHHEDEALPGWVHRRELSPQSYYFEQLPEEPLQQLETPVLYFYAKEPTQLKVEISFPQGIVGEWYPQASAFEPALMQMSRLGGGSMTWDVLADAAISAFPDVSPDEIWAPSRHVASTPVLAGRETEHFIFYRGLARFDPPVRTTVAADGTVTIENASAQQLPAVFLLVSDGTSGTFVSLGALEPGRSVSRLAPRLDRAPALWLDGARAGLASALAATGLCGDEAWAMVDTWTRSWLKNPGMRALYVAPQAWAEQWLPTKVTPAPAEVVRTLVGRIELLTPADEASLDRTLRDAAATGAQVPVASLGRFAEPRLNRALERLPPGAASDSARQLRDQAHAER